MHSILDENYGTRRPASSEVGERGERVALDFLIRNGYRIVTANFTAPVGRDIRGTQVKGEIDIVALDGSTLCFVEVKARSSADFADPLRNVDTRKQRIITRTARVYRRAFNIRSTNFRFDVVTVVDSGTDLRIELHKGYWTEAKFRKKAWADERF